MKHVIAIVFICQFIMTSALLKSRSLFTKQRLFRHAPFSVTSLKDVDNNKHIKLPTPNFAKEMESKYFKFEHFEKDIYSWWESNGYFKPRMNSKRKSFVIPMPPPNVTGYLHMGHALFVAIQDILTRFHRMRGRPTLWLPGTDHAGIATQLLVERTLAAEGTVTRQQLGRDKFLERVWQWKAEKGGYITQQMRRLGASADWSMEKFTLDDDMSASVTEAFIQLYDKGLIYRGNYLVNWSPHLQTAVSDLEVEYSEEMGTLYYFKYMLADGSGEFIPVATTRPETVLGDSAVCVHPEDPRYAKFVGKMLKVPMTDRVVPVIADAIVEREFGTGALKITPAHDVNDYETGKRHDLPIINVMNKDASINAVGGERYQGLDRFVCRKKIWADMSDAGLVIKSEPHMQRVPRSQRGGEVIEPLVSAQWFVKMDNMAERALQAVSSGDMQILPERFEKTWNNWLENIRDWCISRQLWWGHRIPVYYITDPSISSSSATSGDALFVVARSLSEAHLLAEKKYGRAVSLTQDEDVLDTWFSSGLWPFATLGWPHTADSTTSANSATTALKKQYDRFYPATVMETGYDILFFWVARMVMLGLELTDKIPFKTVYLHGLVRDGNGQKMSKTKGNVIDPIDTIAQVGQDTLRFTLVTGSTPGQDIPLSAERLESNRNFMNKLWNMGKYVQLSLALPSTSTTTATTTQYTSSSSPMTAAELNSLPLPERAIVHNLHTLVAKMTLCLEEFKLGEAGQLAYEFLWDELADWYLEVSKTRLNARLGSNDVSAVQTRRVLAYVWETSLRLLHPYLPFLTETLWQQLPHTATANSVESVMLADWPLMTVEKESSSGSSSNSNSNNNEVEFIEGSLVYDDAAAKTFQQFQKLIRGIRNVRAEYKTDMGVKLPAVIRVNTDTAEGLQLLNMLKLELSSLSLLARLDDTNIQIIAISSSSSSSASSTSSSSTSTIDLTQCVQTIIDESVDVFIPLADMIDVEKETLRLNKQMEKLVKDMTGLTNRLKSPGFTDKAPASVVSEVQSVLKDKQDQVKAIQQSLADLMIQK